MKILWLDDAFYKHDKNAPELKTFTKLQELLKNSYRDDVELCKIPNSMDFLDAIEHSGSMVVAAILDVDGYESPDDIVSTREEIDTTGFYKVWKECLNKKIPYAIYSGHIRGGRGADNPFFKKIEDDSIVSVFKGNSGYRHEEKLFKALKNEIDVFLWKDFEYVYNIGAKRFINISSNDNKNLERIIKSYKGDDEIQYDLAFKGTMRIIIESMLDELFKNRPEHRTLFPIFDYSKWKVKEWRLGAGVDCHNDDVDYITVGCPIVEARRRTRGKKYIKRCQGNKSCGIIDYKSPFFPLNVCPQDIKNALSFVWSALNNGLHNRRPIEPDEAREQDEEIIRHFRDYFHNDRSAEAQYARALYDSFFLVLRWYSIFMEKHLYENIHNPNPQNNATHSNAQG